MAFTGQEVPMPSNRSDVTGLFNDFMRTEPSGDLGEFGYYETTSTYVTDSSEGFVFESYPQRVILATMFLSVSVIGILGNSLTILAVLVTAKLQNAINTFVINLAISDLLSCLFIPWSVVALLSREDPFSGNQALSRGCTIAGGMLFISVACSFYTLASIALERLILITYPKQLYHKIFCPLVLVVWVGVIWIVPFSFVVLPPLFGVGALGFNPKYKLCTDISAGYHPNATQKYDFIQAAGGFAVPFVVLVVSYSRIIYYVWSNSKNMVVMEFTRTPETGNTPTSSPYPGRKRGEMVTLSMEDLHKIRKDQGSTTMTRVKKMSRREMTVTKNLFFLFCVFMTCLFPYSVCLVFDETDPAVPFAASLILLNSCINPIIYSCRFPHFKTIFKNIIKCQWYLIPSPTWLLRGFRRVCRCCRPRYTPRASPPRSPQL